jgi:hypothetical protein
MVLGHPSVAQTMRALISTRQHAKSFEGIRVSAKKHWECWGVLGNIMEHQALLGNTWQGWKVSGSLTRSLGKVLATLVPKKQTHTHTHTHTHMPMPTILGAGQKHYPACWHVQDHAEKHASTSASPWVNKHLHSHHDKNPKYPMARVMPTSDQGPGSNLLGTNLDWFEANWILELDYTLVPSLILWFSKLGALLLDCFLVWTNWFSLWNRCHVGLASICHFLVLNPHLKALGPIWSFPPIKLLEFISPCTVDPPLKLA